MVIFELVKNVLYGDIRLVYFTIIDCSLILVCLAHVILLFLYFDADMTNKI